MTTSYTYGGRQKASQECNSARGSNKKQPQSLHVMCSRNNIVSRFPSIYLLELSKLSGVSLTLLWFVLVPQTITPVKYLKSVPASRGGTA